MIVIVYRQRFGTGADFILYFRTGAVFIITLVKVIRVVTGEADQLSFGESVPEHRLQSILHES